MNFFEAKDYCKKLGGALAEVSNMQTQKFLAKEAKKADNNNYHWWIGAQMDTGKEVCHIDFFFHGYC